MRSSHQLGVLRSTKARAIDRNSDWVGFRDAKTR